MAKRLTDAAIKRLPAPTKNNRITYDDEVPGFGIRVTAAGARSFVFNYRTRSGRERRFTIGSHLDWRTTAARDEARRLRRLVDAGGDPLADIEAMRDAPTVAELCDRFEQEHLPRKRPTTAADYRRMLTNHIRPHFGQHTKVADVGFTDIDALHRKIGKAGHKHRANRVVAVASKMFALSIRWKMRDDNPCKGIERNHEGKRKRYLNANELRSLTKALVEHEDRQAANIVRLLLLTGARRGEVLAMKWADVDLTTGTWTKPYSATKQKQDHEVPLSAAARQLLSKISADQKRPLPGFVFPGRDGETHRTTIKRNWRQLTKAASIKNLRIHDLRHSFASELASGGASLPLIGALLGHSNPATTARYSHLYADPQRAAVERVGATYEAATKSETVLVVPIK
jgi:integrase